jgi:hypothetical protein
VTGRKRKRPAPREAGLFPYTEDITARALPQVAPGQPERAFQQEQQQLERLAQVEPRELALPAQAPVRALALAAPVQAASGCAPLSREEPTGPQTTTFARPWSPKEYQPALSHRSDNQTMRFPLPEAWWS